MKTWVESLESRTLLSASAYPVVVANASVLADNAHLTNDKGQLASDTSTFRALIASDKATLNTTVGLDRTAIRADQASVKADQNDPTLLGPAQTVLESAIIKLSGDTASLKTKLSVDSANEHATLRIDNLLVHTDQSFLRIDTQAATAMLQTSIMRLTNDIGAIQARGPASPTVVPTLEGDLTAAAQGKIKPDVSAVSTFASDLVTALNSGGLAAKQQGSLAQDLVDVVNTGSATSAQIQGVIANAGALVSAGGASPADTQACLDGLQAMVV